MKRLLLVILLAIGSSVVKMPAQTAPAAAPDKTLSPYFFVKTDDPSVDRLPLKATSARVDIVGVIARARVTQVYRNEGKRALEAIYVFPGSTRSAVHGMKMTIGERVITAQIQERQEARRQYEEAKQSGRTASLLEQQRPNVFQMNVANILPGDEIKVELEYTELLVPESGTYEFVYPTVVGPRYTRAQAETAADNDRWVQNPYLHQAEQSQTTFDFKATISSGMPLKEVDSPSHKIAVDFGTTASANIRLDASEKSGGNRDLVLRYRLADNRVETGLLLSDGADEKFFVCLVEPPARFSRAAIPPREYVFIVDVSGSMHGFPLDTSKELLRNVVGKLRPIDYFNVLFFSGGSYVLSPHSLQATEANKSFALQEIERQQGGGGTELLPALEEALDLPRPGIEASRVVVIATDGYVDVERQAFTLIRNHLNEANVFAFGIGSSVNRHLIEGLARVGKGTPFVVMNQGEARGAAARFLDYIDSPLLTHIEVKASGFDAYDLEPASVPDLFAARPIVVTGKYRGAPTGYITVTGFTADGRFERQMKITAEQVGAGNGILKYLWARERLALLSDYASVGAGDDTRKEVTALGLKYNLLTAYTSFVAIDQHVRRQDGQLETVKQPLPMPQGVSDFAIGGGGVAAEMSMPRRIAAMASAPADGVDKLGAIAPQAAPAAPPLNKARAFNLSVVENALRDKTVSETTIRQALRTAIAGAVSCFSPAGGSSHKLKVYFDAAGKVRRVEVVDDAATVLKTTNSAACLTAALRSTRLPVASEGYVVIVVRW